MLLALKKAHPFAFMVALAFLSVKSYSQEYRRWQMNPDGSISWTINNNIPHSDHIEMSGKNISCVLRYGVAADGSFQATRSLVWPMLRTIPNNTHASLTRRFAQDAFDLVTVNYKPIDKEKASSISLNGTLIEWCLEYCHRKLNAEGVVNSDSDELEGRFPAGSANLCTSSLYYDALVSATYLGASLGKDKKQLKTYTKQAENLKKSIEKYFGAKIEGFETYKYYKENEALRAWICIPLTMGIFERKAGTIDALFSPKLWTPDGLASLSGESGLYCRIFTEGLFDIRPTGLHRFDLTPRLPADWPSMRLQHLRAFNLDLDITVERAGSKLKGTITDGAKTLVDTLIEAGERLTVELKGN
jgi:hypothetical protein